jgi:hypothetical protein
MGWTSINPSYFDVNRRGTIGFDTLPNLRRRHAWIGFIPPTAGAAEGWKGCNGRISIKHITSYISI